MLYTNKEYSLTKIMVVSALLLSLNLIIKIFTFTIPLAGIPAIQVGFGGSFLAFIGILFGPIYGGISAALSDIIGFLMNPKGAFLWPLTVVAFLKGFSIAFLWHFIKKINFKLYNFVYLLIFIGILILGLINLIFIYFFETSPYAQFITTSSRITPISIGLAIAGSVGIFLHSITWFILYRNKKTELFEIYLRLLVCVGIPSVIFTTLNTFILIEVFSISIPFIYFWLPRLIEEILIILFNTYLLIAIISVYEKIFKTRLTKGKV